MNKGMTTLELVSTLLNEPKYIRFIFLRDITELREHTVTYEEFWGFRYLHEKEVVGMEITPCKDGYALDITI